MAPLVKVCACFSRFRSFDNLIKVCKWLNLDVSVGDTYKSSVFYNVLSLKWEFITPVSFLSERKLLRTLRRKF